MTPSEMQNRVMEILEEHGDFSYAEIETVCPSGYHWYIEIWYNEDRTEVETDALDGTMSLINYLKRTKDIVLAVSTEHTTVKTPVKTTNI